MRVSWSRKKVDKKLRDIMKRIRKECARHGRKDDDHIDYVDGANIGGFQRVADAMSAYGAV